MVTVDKYLWGYGIGIFPTLWIVKDGFQVALVANMALITFFCATAVFLYGGRK